jgi:hypothetical protein
MVTLNKPIKGYLDTKGFIIKTDLVFRLDNNSLSLATFDGLVMTVPLTKEVKAELIKALGE